MCVGLAPDENIFLKSNFLMKVSSYYYMFFGLLNAFKLDNISCYFTEIGSRLEISKAVHLE